MGAKIHTVMIWSHRSAALVLVGSDKPALYSANTARLAAFLISAKTITAFVLAVISGLCKSEKIDCASGDESTPPTLKGRASIDQTWKMCLVRAEQRGVRRPPLPNEWVGRPSTGHQVRAIIRYLAIWRDHNKFAISIPRATNSRKVNKLNGSLSWSRGRTWRIPALGFPQGKWHNNHGCPYFGTVPFRENRLEYWLYY